MLPFRKKKKTASLLLGVALRDEGVAVAAVAPDPGERPRLLFCDYRLCRDDTERAAALSEMTAAHGLTGLECTLALQANEYQLLRAEAPPVEPDELRDAMRWRIKEMIDFPADQAALDVFPLPSGRHGEPGAVVYVAVARKERIKTLVELLRGAGLAPTAVDIGELVLRNLTARYPFDADGSVLLGIEQNRGATMIFRDQALFLARDLNLGERDLHNTLSREQWSDFLDLPQEGQALLDHIVLEVQRTLDYFESHFSTAPPKHLVMLPLASEIEALPRYLGTMLGLEVHTLDLETLLECPEPLSPPERVNGIQAVGAALREWKESAE
ncbi:hypothetical protein [Endothiovibrio diazotrophicus]